MSTRKPESKPQSPDSRKTPRRSKYDEVNDPAFKIPATPEEIAQALLRPVNSR